MITKSSQSRKSALLVLFYSLTLTISAFANGFTDGSIRNPPTGNSSAPGSGNCASCHSPAAGGSGSVALSFSSGSTEYQPGQTSPLTVTVSDSVLRQFGFSMVARSSDNKDVGTWIAGGTDTQVNSDDSTHVNSRNIPTNSNSHTFTVNWTAPAAGLGDVTFYVSALASNRSGSAGDRAFDNHLEVSEVDPLRTVVTTTDDDVPGSLREVVGNAVPGDTITFSPALNGSTITLGGSEIVLNKNVTIDASELLDGITLDGGSNSRIFQQTPGTVVVLQSLTIANGNSADFGGGIYSSGNLTINDCRLLNNQSAVRGGALTSAFGSLTMNRSTVSGNICDFEGGLYLHDINATIRDSTISGNSGARGNGVTVNASSANSTVSMINTTVANNATSSFNAGLEFVAVNGWTCDVTLSHCTVSKNSSAEAGTSGILITETSGGTVSLTMMNSIVSGNTAGGVPSDISGIAGPSSSFNLIGAGGGLTHGINANQIGINTPALGPLCNNGGPTFTMLPLPGSRAIDAGGATELPEDQRGQPRTIGSSTDIGAVESSSNIRWATSVLGFSSQFSPTIWSADQTLGEPNSYPAYGDISTAWASSTSDSQREFLELGYDNFAPINAVSVYETYNPGAVDGISVRNAMTNQWVQVWSGTAAPAGSTSRIFTATFPTTSFPVNGVRLDLNSPAVANWNEIDAVSITPSFGVTPAPGLAAAFAARTILANNVAINGTLVPASVSAGSDGSPAIWQWTPSADGWYDINTFGSSFDTRISAYEGSNSNSLIWLAGNDDAFPGAFAADHPQPDRSAMILPFSAGKIYQFVISGGANGDSGGSLQWAIRPDFQPLPPAVETRTHDFNFPPDEYNAATALIDTIVPIVPIAGYGSPEPYVHVVDTRSAVWKTVVDGDVTAWPYLEAGSTLRTSEADQLSSQPRLSAPVTIPDPDAEDPSAGGFINPPSSTGPYVTVVSARYPHPYGAGHEAICVDLSAQGGQGHGLTHMPKMHFAGDSALIRPDQGGLIIEYHFEGTPPDSTLLSYTLEDADNNVIHSASNQTLEKLVAVDPGPYSICFKKVPGYRTIVTQDGIPNIIEGGTDLINISRDLCVIFPNSIDCSHFGAPNFVTRPVLAASECDVVVDNVTTVNVTFIELASGTDTIGYLDVDDPQESFLQQTDVLGENADGEVMHPLINSPLVRLSSAAQTKVLVMEPEETAPVGRLVTWEKESAGWINFRNFITTGDSSCYECHTHQFGDLPNTPDPDDSFKVKEAGGRPRVPWFQVNPANQTSEDFAERIEPLDDTPYILGMFLHPFEKPLNHRMPIDIEENPDDSAARLATVSYAGRTWQIQQDAGKDYTPEITIPVGNQVDLTPGSRHYTIEFSAEDFWFAELRNSPWIHLVEPTDGEGPGDFSLKLSLDPNPGARPRMGTVQIGDVFFNLIQPIEPPEILSIDELSDPRGFRFTLNPLNGVNYQLEHSESLTPESWIKMGPSIVGERGPSPLTFDALFSDLPSHQFYRIRSSPPE